jgi:multiple sugar transport system ATP-binding protein
MGRAIVRNPQVFLFDEPLSNLDAKLRVQMRAEIRELHQRLATTTVYVTHDQIEAMTMADKIVVMNAGIVEQMGTPLELYDHPDNTFVAGFIGSPAMNFIDGTFRAGDAPAVVAADGTEFQVANAGRAVDGQAVTLGIRPEHLVISEDGVEGDVIVVEPTGSETQVVVRIGGKDVIGVFRERHDFHPGERIHFHAQPDLVHLFDKGTGKHL